MNFSLSSSGFRSSSASSRTRSLNSNHESSRLMYSDGWSSGCGAGATAIGCDAIEEVVSTDDGPLTPPSHARGTFGERPHGCSRNRRSPGDLYGSRKPRASGRPRGGEHRAGDSELNDLDAD